MPIPISERIQKRRNALRAMRLITPSSGGQSDVLDKRSY